MAFYIFGCKRNTAISSNKPKHTFLLVTSVLLVDSPRVNTGISQICVHAIHSIALVTSLKMA